MIQTDKPNSPNTKTTDYSSKEHLIHPAYYAVATGIYTGIGSAATFGVVRPSAEIVFTSILGQPQRRSNIFAADSTTRFVWVFAAAWAGFVMGFTHTVISKSCSNFTAQYLGYTEFSFSRQRGSNFGQKATNVMVDVCSYDLISVIFFGLSGTLRNTVFHKTGASPVLRMMFSSSIGGFCTGVVSHVVKKMQPCNFESKRHFWLPAKTRQTFFTHFEEQIGRVIHQEDYCSWFMDFVAIVIAATLWRPLCIIVGDLIRTSIEDQYSEKRRALSTIQGTARAVTFEVGWFLTIRLCQLFLYLRREDGRENYVETKAVPTESPAYSETSEIIVSP